jgi:hypothetical protein
VVARLVRGGRLDIDSQSLDLEGGGAGWEAT